MKYLFIFILFNFIQNSFAQFAIISDKDGFVNIRSEPNKTSKIVGKIEDGTVFYIFQYEPNKSDWISFSCLEESCKIVGYVHKSRVKLVSQFEKIDIKSDNEQEIVFEKDSVKVNIVLEDFNKKAHDFTYSKDSNFIEKIDGENFWGTDGGIPKKQYRSVEIEIGQSKIFIPLKGLKNLFNPNMHNPFTEVNIFRQKNILYISCGNGDGAGGYDLLWIIEKGKYKNRFIEFGF